MTGRVIATSGDMAKPDQLALADGQPPGVAPRPQLLTYPDSLGGNLRALGQLMDGPLAGLFHGVHILPPFPSSGDRGFAPLTYDVIDPRFGSWEDLRRIGARHDVLLDLMINHISRQSPEFQAFLRRGRRSPHADLFITLDKVWPNGDPAEGDVARIFLRKPDAPFSTVTIEDTGEREQIWTSFGTADWSEQIDLDVTSAATRALITNWLRSFAERGVRIVRLDAVGYVIKKPGTTCFMVEPEIYGFLEWVTQVAGSFGLAVLPEVHDEYGTHQRLSEHGFWTYDFVLPALLLHAFQSGRLDRLAAHLDRSPDRQFTTLDCHDGIPVRPDLDGILEPQRDAASRGAMSPTVAAMSTGSSPAPMPVASTCTSSIARTTRPWTPTTIATSSHGRSSCSRGASRRSITSACSRARTIGWPSSVRATGGRSIAATTPRTRSRRRWTGRWSSGSSTWCGSGTRIRRSTASSASCRPTIARSSFGGVAATPAWPSRWTLPRGGRRSSMITSARTSRRGRNERRARHSGFARARTVADHACGLERQRAPPFGGARRLSALVRTQPPILKTLPPQIGHVP